MRRFFAATFTALALLLATPVHSQPLADLDASSWLDNLSSWVLEFIANVAEKTDEDEPASPPANDSDDTQTPPPEDARGEICGDG